MAEDLEDRFDRLFLAEFPKVCREIQAMVGDSEVAKDVTQEAFVRLYAHWKKISAYEKPGAWVRRVAIRIAGRSLRARFRTREIRESAARTKDRAELDLIDLEPALLSLPMSQRAVVVLHFLEDRPMAEVARIVGCSPGAARVRLHRALKKMALQMGEELGDVPV